MKRTISAMVGKGSVTHNSRSFTAENVDSECTHLNIDYCNEPIKKVYHELFYEALKQYNDKQKRKDRKISDYYKHIESGKQEKLFHEIIFQTATWKICRQQESTPSLRGQSSTNTIRASKNAIHICECSRRTFIWTKQRRISISTLYRSPPGAIEVWKHEFR